MFKILTDILASVCEMLYDVKGRGVHSSCLGCVWVFRYVRYDPERPFLGSISKAFQHFQSCTTLMGINDRQLCPCYLPEYTKVNFA